MNLASAITLMKKGSNNIGRHIIGSLQSPHVLVIHRTIHICKVIQNEEKNQNRISLLHNVNNNTLNEEFKV